MSVAAAWQAYNDKRFKDAFFAASGTLNNNPDDHTANYIAGISLLRAGHYACSRPYLLTAAKLRGTEEASAINDLGRSYQDGGDHEQALRWFRIGALCEPGAVAPTSNAALIYLNEGEFATAERWALRSVTLKPSEPAVYDNLALCRLARGAFTSGWRLYERSIGIERRHERIYGEEPRWKGPEVDRSLAESGAIPTRSLVCYGEQGVGDEILHSACVPDLLADGPKQVTIETQPGLVGLFKRSFPRAANVIGTRHQKVVVTGLDARVSMAVLGQWYRRDVKDYDKPAHLVADPERRAMVRGLLDAIPGLKVGIAWTGGTPSTRKRVRSTTPDAIYNQLKHLPVTMVSLEYCETDVSAFPKLRHFPWLVNTPDYDDTAALVAELDCVVCVTTSVAHLAGALGVPTFILTPDPPNWKYSHEMNPGDQFYWWRSAKLIRPRSGRWNLEPVRDFLRKRA